MEGGNVKYEIKAEPTEETLLTGDSPASSPEPAQDGFKEEDQSDEEPLELDPADVVSQRSNFESDEDRFV